MSQEPSTELDNQLKAAGNSLTLKHKPSEIDLNFEALKSTLIECLKDIKKELREKEKFALFQTKNSRLINTVSSLGSENYMQRVQDTFEHLEKESIDFLSDKEASLQEGILELIEKSGVLAGKKNENGIQIQAIDLATTEILHYLYQGLKQCALADEHQRACRVQDMANTRPYNQELSDSLHIAPVDSSEKDKKTAFKDDAKDLFDYTGGQFQCTKTKAQFSVDSHGNVQGTNSWQPAAADTFAKVTINQALRKGWNPTNLNGTPSQLVSVTKALLQNGMNTPVAISQITLKSAKPAERKKLQLNIALINNTPTNKKLSSGESAASTLNNISLFEQDVSVTDALSALVRNKPGFNNPQAQFDLFTTLNKEPLNISKTDFLKAMPKVTKDHVKALMSQSELGSHNPNEHKQEDSANKKPGDPENGSNRPSI